MPTIKRSSLKFRDQRADDALKQADEKFQQRRAAVGEGESEVLSEQAGEHETVEMEYMT